MACQRAVASNARKQGRGRGRGHGRACRWWAQVCAWGAHCNLHGCKKVQASKQCSKPALTLSSGRLAGEPAGLDSCSVICTEQAGWRELLARAGHAACKLSLHSKHPCIHKSALCLGEVHASSTASDCTAHGNESCHNSLPSVSLQSGTPPRQKHRHPRHGTPGGGQSKHAVVLNRAGRSQKCG